jgi:hypothetical protein
VTVKNLPGTLQRPCREYGVNGVWHKIEDDNHTPVFL